MNRRSAAEVRTNEPFRPNGKPHRQAASNGRGVALVPEISHAPFAALAAEPVDAPMWPIHQGGWLQPESPPVLDEAVEAARTHRFPAGGFVETGVLQPLDFPARAEAASEAEGRPDKGSLVTPCDRAANVLKEVAAPEAQCRPAKGPASDLSPLGWDPRTLIGKEGVE